MRIGSPVCWSITPFADDNALSYFRQRLNEAPREVEFGLSYVLDNADTVEKQDAAVAALIFKTNVLWSQLDALYFAYIVPGFIPPGAWNGHDGINADEGEIVQAARTVGS
jgi:pyrroloquinoline-quinone synthase